MSNNKELEKYTKSISREDCLGLVMFKLDNTAYQKIGSSQILKREKHFNDKLDFYCNKYPHIIQRNEGRKEGEYIFEIKKPYKLIRCESSMDLYVILEFDSKMNCLLTGAD